MFTSDRYAQVTASLIVSGTVGVMIDTLPFPEETGQIALFARRRCPDGVRYVIYTQHQADHVYGAFLFPKAEIIAHSTCRDILIEKGYKALETARQQSRELQIVRLRLPTITFNRGVFALKLPGKTLEIFPSPGHTPDSVSVVLQEEKILFAGDTIMAIPTIGEGDIDQLRASIEAVAAMPLETIVQGHGEIILRGEIKDNLRRSLNYLDHLQTKVQKIVEAGGTREEARRITLESCGLQRVLLSGVVTQLHQANVLALYDRLTAKLNPLAAGSISETASKPSPSADGSARSGRARSGRVRSGRVRKGSGSTGTTKLRPAPSKSSNKSTSQTTNSPRSASSQGRRKA
ncbi:MAG: MBL fold metallo-hydrolase [Anaerolineae bacterium]|nr:MBL fold metallo-hydrolase [Thermoflexales bacterium]MDW8406729.1 MBL fold metallo-hydrolase [Anaerolineae bacterium]